MPIIVITVHRGANMAIDKPIKNTWATQSHEVSLEHTKYKGCLTEAKGGEESIPCRWICEEEQTLACNQKAQNQWFHEDFDI